MISYRSSHKLNSYLIRTELYPINRTVGCYKYGSKRCEVHKYVTELILLLAMTNGKLLR